MTPLSEEIAQSRPFSTREEEALLNLLRTTDCVQRVIQRKIKPWGVTSTQYNVLRILRGSLPDGLTCSAIGDRMITAEPDITRLLARLKALKLIRQQRDKRDKRVVWTQISPVGLALLADMDPHIVRFTRELLGHFDPDQLNTFIRFLEMARQPCSDPGGPVSCDGSSPLRAESSVPGAARHAGTQP